MRENAVKALIVLDFATVVDDKSTDRISMNASQRHEEELGHLVGDDPRAAALHIRELEIVAGLAIEALRTAGDEATAEVVRAVLESKTE